MRGEICDLVGEVVLRDGFEGVGEMFTFISLKLMGIVEGGRKVPGKVC